MKTSYRMDKILSSKKQSEPDSQKIQEVVTNAPVGSKEDVTFSDDTKIITSESSTSTEVSTISSDIPKPNSSMDIDSNDNVGLELDYEEIVNTRAQNSPVNLTSDGSIVVDDVYTVNNDPVSNSGVTKSIQEQFNVGVSAIKKTIQDQFNLEKRFAAASSNPSKRVSERSLIGNCHYPPYKRGINFLRQLLGQPLDGGVSDEMLINCKDNTKFLELASKRFAFLRMNDNSWFTECMIMYILSTLIVRTCKLVYESQRVIEYILMILILFAYVAIHLEILDDRRSFAAIDERRQRAIKGPQTIVMGSKVKNLYQKKDDVQDMGYLKPR